MEATGRFGGKNGIIGDNGVQMVIASAWLAAKSHWSAKSRGNEHYTISARLKI